MEFIIALSIIALAGLGLGLGVLFGRGAAQTSCGAAGCLPDTDCEDCPLRRASASAKGSS